MTDKKGKTALMWAAENGKYEAARYLSSSYETRYVMMKDGKGETAAYKARKNKHVALADMLDLKASGAGKNRSSRCRRQLKGTARCWRKG